MATVISERELSWFEVELHNKRANEVGENEMKKKKFFELYEIVHKIGRTTGTEGTRKIYMRAASSK